jgi:hypothetical protein
MGPADGTGDRLDVIDHARGTCDWIDSTDALHGLGSRASLSTVVKTSAVRIMIEMLLANSIGGDARPWLLLDKLTGSSRAS